MDRLLRSAVVSLLLLAATQAHADNAFMVSPSLGSASISNISGYNRAAFLRVDGAYRPIPAFGVGGFVVGYQDFKPSSGTAVAIKLRGAGLSLTGRWPVGEHVQPYVRADYLFWQAEATGIGRTLAKDNGRSPGLALGAQFPIKRMFGVKAEVAGYNNVSGADIRQLSVGLTLDF
jgi:hypothetical protein